MNAGASDSRARADLSDLRIRAEAKLKKELAINNTSQLQDVGIQLFEKRINQIEIELLSEELLSEEFNKLKNIRSLHIQPDQAKYGYILLDRDGRICEARLVATQASGEKTFTGLGRLLADFVQPDIREQFRQFLQQTFESDSRMSCELSFVGANHHKQLGLKLPLHVSVNAVADDEKRYCIVVFEDVSARKLAEIEAASHRDAVAILENTIAASLNEIFMVDAHSNRFTYANQCALQNLGYTLDELKALTPGDIRTDGNNENISELIGHKRKDAKFSALHRRKDGTMYPVEIYLQLMEQETGSYFITIAQDISSQIAIESQLKSIVESSSAIILAADVNLRLVFISDQVLNILGRKANQLVGHSLADLLDGGIFHESDRDSLTDGFASVLRHGVKVSGLRYRARHADGTWRWLSMNMMPNRAVDGTVCQIVGVMHDIHAQKMAEDALLDLNRELDSRVRQEIEKNKEKDLMLMRQSKLAGMGEMIGNIAHQWRQPINSLGLIMSDLEDAARYGECDLAYIHNAAAKSKKIIQKMSCTIDDFRHFFRIDKSICTFGLLKVTEECLNLVDASMKSSNISIVVRCEREVNVTGYANEYSQALMNILSNARDAIIERKVAGGEIIVEIGQDGEFGVHRISDNGGGIAVEVLPKIFDPHFTTKENGVGIGLYMTVLSVEKNMNGRIAVENTAHGARFSLYLPRAESGDDHVIH